MNEEEKQLLMKLAEDIQTLRQNPLMADHRHTGFDVSRVMFEDISQRKIWIRDTIKDTDAATAAKYGPFFIAPFACYVSGYQEDHRTAGTDGSAVTLDLEKLTSGTAPDSGVSVLSSPVSLKTTANTPQNSTITTTLANLNLVRGDRLCHKDAGTLTSVNNVTVVVELTII
jgi:hypothetical protein